MLSLRTGTRLTTLLILSLVTSSSILTSEESPITFIQGEDNHLFAIFRTDVTHFASLPTKAKRTNENVIDAITTLLEKEESALPFILPLDSSDGVTTIYFPLASYPTSKLFADEIKIKRITAEKFTKLYPLLYTYDFNKSTVRSTYVDGVMRPALNDYEELLLLGASYVESCDHMKKHRGSMKDSPGLYRSPVSTH
ncbi:MAG: hypothetical protein PVJ92_02835 [Candidatus Dependentiae bacterium]|jgi:hypothetical protein